MEQLIQCPDYNLALLIMNTALYMTNESILLVENENLFSPISQLNYSFYQDEKETRASLSADALVQCISGTPEILFGKTQVPSLFNYADGIDTIQFLLSL